jgi:hypothetical protein
MQIQNTSAQFIHAEHNNAAQTHTSTLVGNVNLLAKTSNSLLHAGGHTSFIGIQPDVQKILHAAFAWQRGEILNQPSSSNSNSRRLALEALDILEPRGFQPAEGGLKIRLTGKGLGGGSSSDSSSDSDPAEDVKHWKTEVAAWESSTIDAATTLYNAGLALAHAQRSGASRSDISTLMDARDECDNVLKDCKGNLKDAKEELRSAEKKLSKKR